MDEDFDQALLDLLRSNARMSTAELGRRLGKARSTIQSRLERLERAGTIAGYTIKTADSVEQAMLKAHVMIQVVPAQQRAVERYLMRLPAVRTLYTISGNFDLIALLRAKTTAELDQLLDLIREIDGVRATESAIVLSVRLDR